jgi:hypothetical protein
MAGKDLAGTGAAIRGAMAMAGAAATAGTAGVAAARGAPAGTVPLMRLLPLTLFTSLTPLMPLLPLTLFTSLTPLMPLRPLTLFTSLTPLLSLTAAKVGMAAMAVKEAGSGSIRQRRVTASAFGSKP